MPVLVEPSGEGAFFPLVFYSAARLPGSLVQVLNQTLIPFTATCQATQVDFKHIPMLECICGFKLPSRRKVLFSFVCLKRRYDSTQMLGVVAAWTHVLHYVRRYCQGTFYDPAARGGILPALCCKCFKVVLCGVTLFTSLPQSSGSPSVFLVLCIAAYGSCAECPHTSMSLMSDSACDSEASSSSILGSTRGMNDHPLVVSK